LSNEPNDDALIDIALAFGGYADKLSPASKP
jgi:hypothetical protein